MYRPTSPCKDCPDRFGGCHSVCEKYQYFKAKNEQYKKEMLGTGAEFKRGDWTKLEHEYLRG